MKWAVLGIVSVVAGVLLYYGTRGGGRPPSEGDEDGVTRVLPAPFVMFRTLAPAERYGLVAMLPALTPASARVFTKLSCARVYYAGGSGACLVEEREGNHVAHAAYFFDHTLTRGKRLLLSGIPTRARISPDGRRAAITVYGEEEAPGGGERLATDTVLVDLPKAIVFATLRDFVLDGPGKPAAGVALDYSSVAFSQDGDRLFATLSASGNWYIVAGSIRARRLAIVAEGLASEALSPDDARLAVKRRVGERGFWQAMVFDVGSKSVEPLRHTRSIDDQIEWLDRDHILYHDAMEQGTGIWALAVDGRSEPRLLIRDAYSPAVQH